MRVKIFSFIQKYIFHVQDARQRLSAIDKTQVAYVSWVKIETILFLKTYLTLITIASQNIRYLLIIDMWAACHRIMQTLCTVCIFIPLVRQALKNILVLDVSRTYTDIEGESKEKKTQTRSLSTYNFSFGRMTGIVSRIRSVWTSQACNAD